MAVTVNGNNYSQISSCDSGSAGGTWGGSPTADSDNYMEGSASISDILKGSGNNDWTFTPTSSIDLSGGEHLRIWLLATQGGLINTLASGGIQLWISDGTNTGYWYLAGKDTYPGGWINLVVDTASNVDSGTKPTAMNAITTLGIRINLTGTAKNADNTWVDNFCTCDGLIAYGLDGVDPFDFSHIEAGDAGKGIIREINGQYFLTGDLTIGDATSAATLFQATSQVVVFENRPVSTTLYGITVVDNGTVTTNFQLGSKSGTAGVEGCTIRVAEVTQTPKFFVDAATDTDVDNFKMYGTTVLDAGTIEFPASATNVEILNCNFEKCGEMLVSTAKMENSNVVSPDDRGIRLASTSHNVADCNFIDCEDAIHCNTTGTFIFDNLQFVNCTYDVENSNNATTTDSYSESNKDADRPLGNGSIDGRGQSFTGDGNKLSSASFYLQRVGTLTGNIEAKLYAHTGTFGTDGTPTGSTLATSEPVVASGVGTSYGLIKFDFDGTVTVTNTTKYFIVLEYTAGDGSNYINMGADSSTPGHGGNMAYHNGSIWVDDNKDDMCFYLRTGGVVTISATNAANPADHEETGTPAGTTVVKNDVYITITVKDSGGTVIQNAQTAVYRSSDGTQLMNEDTLVTGIAQETFNYPGSDVAVYIRVRKSSTGSTRYKPVDTQGSISGTGLQTTVVLQEDTIVA